MAVNKIHEIKVNTLMDQVCLAVAKRRRGDFSVEQQPVDDMAKMDFSEGTVLIQSQEVTRLWKILKRVQNTSRRFAFYDYLHFHIAVKFKKFIPKHSAQYGTDIFLKYEDEEFLDHAYRAILGSKAEPAAHADYLSKLRNRQLSKQEILVILRYSPEGRKQGVKIKGMFGLFVLCESYKIPVIGSFFKKMRQG